MFKSGVQKLCVFLHYYFCSVHLQRSNERPASSVGEHNAMCLSWLSFCPFVVHHWLMLTRLFCVTSLKVSAPKRCFPVYCFGVVATDTSARSSANPILFLVKSSNWIDNKIPQEWRSNPCLWKNLFDSYDFLLSLQFDRCLPVMDHWHGPSVDS